MTRYEALHLRRELEYALDRMRELRLVIAYLRERLDETDDYVRGLA